MGLRLPRSASLLSRSASRSSCALSWRAMLAVALLLCAQCVSHESDAISLCPPQWVHAPWRRILRQQAAAAMLLVRGIRPPLHGITISLRNSSIRSVHRGAGWVHPERANQYTALFQQACRRRRLPDFDVNINLNDFPMDGVFNFCRKSGRYEQFLLPNHRFTRDDVYPGGVPAWQRFPTYDEQLANLSNDRPFVSKRPRAYAALRPHRDKVSLIAAVLAAPGELAVYTHTGPPHFDLALPKEMKKKLLERGMAGEAPRRWEEHREWAFLIHPAGNTLSDRLRLLLPLNAVVLKLERTRKYEEVYTALMDPWKHYVPVSPANLSATVRSLRNNNALSLRLIAGQHRFVESVLRYDRLLDYVHDLLWLLASNGTAACAQRNARALP